MPETAGQIIRGGLGMVLEHRTTLIEFGSYVPASGTYAFRGESLPVSGFVVEFFVIFIRVSGIGNWRETGWFNWTRKTTGTVAPRVTIGDATDNSPVHGQTPQVSLSSANGWYSTFDFNWLTISNSGPPRNVYCNVGGVPAPSAGNLVNW